MSSFKDALMKRGMRWMSDPRVMRLLQDERLMKALMVAMSVPGKAQTFARERVFALAKAMALATEDEVKDLRRTVRSLEDELRQVKSEQNAARRKSSAAE